MKKGVPLKRVPRFIRVGEGHINMKKGEKIGETLRERIRITAQGELPQQLCSASPSHSATTGKGHHSICRILPPSCSVSFQLPVMAYQKNFTLNQETWKFAASIVRCPNEFKTLGQQGQVNIASEPHEF